MFGTRARVLCSVHVTWECLHKECSATWTELKKAIGKDAAGFKAIRQQIDVEKSASRG